MPVPEVEQQLVGEMVGLLRKHGWQVGLEAVEAWLEEMRARAERIPVDGAADFVVG
jgi:hypothetical protein